MDDYEAQARARASVLEEVKADLEAALSMPLPNTNAERVALLESHLKSALARRAADQVQLTFDAENLDATLAAVRETASWIYKASRPVEFDISPCGVAVLEGVGLITAGSVFGPGGALLGFGAGVYLLTQHCGEGDTFFT